MKTAVEGTGSSIDRTAIPPFHIPPNLYTQCIYRLRQLFLCETGDRSTEKSQRHAQYHRIYKMLAFLLHRQARITTTLPSLTVAVRSKCTATAQAFEDRILSETVVQPFSAIPGPKPLPILRNALEFKRNVPTLHLYLNDCYEEFGEIFKLEVPGTY